MKSKKIDSLMLVILFLILITLGFIAIRMQEDGALCLKDPLNYGYNRLQEANNKEISCSCTLSGINGASLSFNGTSSKITNTFTPNSEPVGYQELNLTLLNKSFLNDP